MTIKIGDKIPSVTLKTLTDGGMQDVSTAALFNNKKIVMFAVPGAFTPTCTARHLPAYIQNIEKFKSMGIDVVCMAVNDPFVMKAWGDSQNATGIQMLSDGNGTFTKALGLEMDGTGFGLGVRSQRFALYAVNGTVQHLAVEQGGALEVSSAEAMVKAVAETQKAA